MISVDLADFKLCSSDSALMSSLEPVMEGAEPGKSESGLEKVGVVEAVIVQWREGVSASRDSAVNLPSPASRLRSSQQLASDAAPPCRPFIHAHALSRPMTNGILGMFFSLQPLPLAP